MSESLKIDTSPRAASNVGLSRPLRVVRHGGSPPAHGGTREDRRHGQLGAPRRARLRAASASRFACGSACGDRVRAVQ